MLLANRNYNFSNSNGVLEQNYLDLLKTIHSYSATDGSKLSPIDFPLNHSNVIHLPPILWMNYQTPAEKIKVTNNGVTAIVKGKWAERPFIQSGPLVSDYVFAQIHFHWGEHNTTGSEHAIDGIRYPLEMHVVHFKREYVNLEEALHREDGVVVLVHLFDIQENCDSILDQITNVLPLMQVARTSVELTPASLAVLVQPFSADYYLYWGSITSELRRHRVLWLVSRMILPISSKQIDEFRRLQNYKGDLLTKNSSEPYKLEGRALFLVSPTIPFDNPVYGVTRKVFKNEIKYSTSSTLDISDIEYKSLTCMTNKNINKKKVLKENDDIKYKKKVKLHSTEELHNKMTVYHKVNYLTPCGKRVCSSHNKAVPKSKVNIINSKLTELSGNSSDNAYSKTTTLVSEVTIPQMTKRIVNSETSLSSLYISGNKSKSLTHIYESQDKYPKKSRSLLSIKRNIYMNKVDSSTENSWVLMDSIQQNRNKDDSKSNITSTFSSSKYILPTCNSPDQFGNNNFDDNVKINKSQIFEVNLTQTISKANANNPHAVNISEYGTCDKFMIKILNTEKRFYEDSLKKSKRIIEYKKREEENETKKGSKTRFKHIIEKEYVNDNNENVRLKNSLYNYTGNGPRNLSDATLKYDRKSKNVKEIFKRKEENSPKLLYEINSPIKGKKILVEHKIPISYKIADRRPHVCYKIFEPITPPIKTEIFPDSFNKLNLNSDNNVNLSKFVFHKNFIDSAEQSILSYKREESEEDINVDTFNECTSRETIDGSTKSMKNKLGASKSFETLEKEILLSKPISFILKTKSRSNKELQKHLISDLSLSQSNKRPLTDIKYYMTSIKTKVNQPKDIKDSEEDDEQNILQITNKVTLKSLDTNLEEISKTNTSKDNPILYKSQMKRINAEPDQDVTKHNVPKLLVSPPEIEDIDTDVDSESPKLFSTKYFSEKINDNSLNAIKSKRTLLNQIAKQEDMFIGDDNSPYCIIDHQQIQEDLHNEKYSRILQMSEKQTFIKNNPRLIENLIIDQIKIPVDEFELLKQIQGNEKRTKFIQDVKTVNEVFKITNNDNLKGRILKNNVNFKDFECSHKLEHQNTKYFQSERKINSAYIMRDNKDDVKENITQLTTSRESGSKMLNSDSSKVFIKRNTLIKLINLQNRKFSRKGDNDKEPSCLQVNYETLPNHSVVGNSNIEGKMDWFSVWPNDLKTNKHSRIEEINVNNIMNYSCDKIKKIRHKEPIVLNGNINADLQEIESNSENYEVNSVNGSMISKQLRPTIKESKNCTFPEHHYVENEVKKEKNSIQYEKTFGIKLASTTDQQIYFETKNKNSELSKDGEMYGTEEISENHVFDKDILLSQTEHKSMNELISIERNDKRNINSDVDVHVQNEEMYERSIKKSQKHSLIKILPKQTLMEQKIFIVNKIPKDRLTFINVLPVGDLNSTTMQYKLENDKIDKKKEVSTSQFYFDSKKSHFSPKNQIKKLPTEKIELLHTKSSNLKNETIYIKGVKVVDKITQEEKYKHARKVTTYKTDLNDNIELIHECNIEPYKISAETKINDETGEDSVVVYIRQEKTPASHIQPTITIDYTKAKDMTVSDLNMQKVCIREMNPTTSKVINEQFLIPNKNDKTESTRKSTEEFQQDNNDYQETIKNKSDFFFTPESLTVAFVPEGKHYPAIYDKTSLKDKSLYLNTTPTKRIKRVNKESYKLDSAHFSRNNSTSKKASRSFSFIWPKERPDIYSGFQSPIHLYPCRFPLREFPRLHFSNHWTCRGQTIMENTGKTIRVTLKPNSDVDRPNISGGPLFDNYLFEELIFHWGDSDSCGAEHVFDQEHRCLEAQFVYYKKSYGSMKPALNHPDGVACLSITFKTGGPIDDDFDDIIDGVKKVFEPDTSIKFPASAMFKWLEKHIDSSHSYITYPGSLTMRPFNECVTWIVITDAFVFCCQQSIQFQRILGRDKRPIKNFRKQQPYNMRPIYFVPLK